LRNLAQSIVAPYDDPPGRIAISGPELELPPRFNVPLALALHELSTNAAKYGALAAASGRVDLTWSATPGGITLDWVEKGGPPVSSPVERGFGMRLIADILAVELGEVTLDTRPEGVTCRIAISL
jgi:two-component sensor histidine kinase